MELKTIFHEDFPRKMFAVMDDVPEEFSAWIV